MRNLKGHRTSIIGTPPVRHVHTPPPVRRGEKIGATFVVVHDNQVEAVAARDRERRRRALWDWCERRPLRHD